MHRRHPWTINEDALPSDYPCSRRASTAVRVSTISHRLTQAETRTSVLRHDPRSCTRGMMFVTRALAPSAVVVDELAGWDIKISMLSPERSDLLPCPSLVDADKPLQRISYFAKLASGEAVDVLSFGPFTITAQCSDEYDEVRRGRFCSRHHVLFLSWPYVATTRS